MQISSDANAARAPQIPTPISTGAKVSPSPALSYSTLASFSWDQDVDKVKVRSRIILFVEEILAIMVLSMYLNVID